MGTTRQKKVPMQEKVEHALKRAGVDGPVGALIEQDRLGIRSGVLVGEIMMDRSEVLAQPGVYFQYKMAKKAVSEIMKR